MTGETVIIPNKDIFQNPIENYTRTQDRRVDIPVGVSYGDDLERAQEVATRAVEAVRPRNLSRPVEVFYSEFGESSINFELRFWIQDAQQTPYLDARSKAIKAIKAAFDREGITIPFPIRTLDFAKVGGDTLGEVLSRYRDESRSEGQPPPSSEGGFLRP